MKLKIFMLAFCAGFAIFFSVAAVFVYRYSDYMQSPEEPAAEEDSAPAFAEKTALLLIFEEDGKTGPFSVVCFDGEKGRIPVISFPAEVVFESVPGKKTAGELFSSLSRKDFLSAAERELGIKISAWFLWNKATCEEVISKAGAFDYILPKDLYYSDGERYINLSAGVQSVTGKKFYDMITYPGFDQIDRCDTASRLISIFLGRRLRRFAPEGAALSSAVYESTENSADAFFRAELHGIIAGLCSEKKPVASHVTCDLEPFEEGVFRFSKSTRERFIKYFPPLSE